MEIIRFGYDGVLLDDSKKNYFTGAPPGYFHGPFNSLVNYFDNSLLNIPKYFAERLFKIKFPVTDIDAAARNTKLPHLIYSLQKTPNTVGYLNKGQYNESYPYILKQAHYEEFLKNNEYFLFPYFPNADSFFRTDQQISGPPDKVITAAYEGKCKIVFIYLNEGHVYSGHQFDLLYEFAKKHKLSHNELEFYHCNLKIKETASKFYPDINDFINFIPVNFFEIDLWFNKDFNRFSREQTLPAIHKKTKSLFSEYTQSIKPKRFLCLNRMARGHRFNICCFLYSQKDINFNSLWSLGPFIGNTLKEKEESYEHQKHSCSILLNEYENIHTFFEDNKKALFTTGIVLDEPTFKDKNLADQVNIDLHKQTYISIITETEYHEETIFFSEKIFKPMSVYHPFILIGSPGSLAKLKEFGYKTFDKWWDESYDNEINYTQRFRKIVKLIEELNRKPIEEIHSMVIDMESVLTHNYNHLYSSNRHIELIKMLSCESVTVKNLI